MPHVAFHTFPVPDFSSPVFSSLAFSASPLGVSESKQNSIAFPITTTLSRNSETIQYSTRTWVSTWTYATAATTKNCLWLRIKVRPTALGFGLEITFGGWSYGLGLWLGFGIEVRGLGLGFGFGFGFGFRVGIRVWSYGGREFGLWLKLGFGMSLGLG